MKPIPLVDLKAQYDSIKDEIDGAIKKVIQSCSFVLGPEINLFEEEFAKFCQAKFSAGVASGTDALKLALIACGIGKGDEIITTPTTFVATAEAITRVGGRPVFCDIDKKTYNIDPAKIESLVTKKTKAIIPVHLFGNPADMISILDIAERHRLLVIEDAAQAHGALCKGRRVGSIGNIGCFSFYPGKNLGAYGDGGCIVTNEKGLIEKIRILRDHGRVGKYEHLVLGFNSRLDGLQAAILRVKLKYLDKWNEKRRELAKVYYEKLKGINEVVLPQISEGAVSVFHLYVIRTKQRDKLRSSLKEAGISTEVHYPIPLHLQKVFGDLGYKKGDFPVTEEYNEEFLSLPIYPELGESGVSRVAEAIRQFYGK